MQAALRLVLVLPLAFACSESMNPPPDPQVGLTYQKDLRALVEDNCVACHVEDGIGPFALDSFEAMKLYAPVVISEVEQGHMPPWLPDPNCRRFRDERILTEEQ